MKAIIRKHTLDFKRPSGTSRGVLYQKDTWLLILEKNGDYGIGECNMFKGLSYDDVPDYEEKLGWVCRNIHLGLDALLDRLSHFPSIQFGLEQAFMSLDAQDPFLLFPSDFTKGQKGIPINGLIWMGDKAYMLEQIQQKLKTGFTCIKMKIGAIDFKAELDLLAAIRKEYSKEEIELRVDANGAFEPQEALEKLRALSKLNLHSIEQPIRQGLSEGMGHLCAKSPLPIALDEELIGVVDFHAKRGLLQTIHPQYIILKPSLVGGFRGSREWISIADELGIGWWITSALESNIGLNAIAQWTFTLNSAMPQGLGTGGLFTNNFDSPLQVENGYIYANATKNWKPNLIQDLCI